MADRCLLTLPLLTGVVMFLSLSLRAASGVRRPEPGAGLCVDEPGPVEAQAKQSSVHMCPCKVGQGHQSCSRLEWPLRSPGVSCLRNGIDSAAARLGVRSPRRDGPSSTCAARAAKLRLDSVSPVDEASGATLHTSSVLVLVAVHNESCSAYNMHQRRQDLVASARAPGSWQHACSDAISRVSGWLAHASAASGVSSMVQQTWVSLELR